MFMKSFAPQSYALMRMVTGFLFMWHGTQKLFGFPILPQGEPAAHVVFIAGPIDLIGGFLVDDRSLHPLGGVSLQRADGGGLLDGARDTGGVSDRQSRCAGGPLLFRLPLHRPGTGNLERRRRPRPRLIWAAEKVHPRRSLSLGNPHVRYSTLRVPRSLRLATYL